MHLIHVHPAAGLLVTVHYTHAHWWVPGNCADSLYVVGRCSFVLCHLISCTRVPFVFTIPCNIFFAMFAAMVEMGTHTAAQDLLFSPPPPF